MCGANARKRRLLTKQDFGPEEERAFQFFLDEYRGALGPLQDDIERWLAGADSSDLQSLETIRSEVSSRIGGYTSDFETVFREGSRQGAEAGRAVAVRRFGVDVAFDTIPARTLETLDEWVETAAGSTLETITEDSARWLRGAHEDGLSIPDISDRLNDELFAGRLEDHVAERAARTATISTSNAGTHSALEDAESVIGEQWLATSDARTRDDHADADGQVVAVETSFEVGGIYMGHPGDPGAAVNQIANCRCTIVPVFADEVTDAQQAALEAGERLYLDL